MITDAYWELDFESTYPVQESTVTEEYRLLPHEFETWSELAVIEALEIDDLLDEIEQERVNTKLLSA